MISSHYVIVIYSYRLAIVYCDGNGDCSLPCIQACMHEFEYLYKSS